MKRGFTLVELMIASSISVLVVGGVLAAFIGVQRLTKSAMAEAELSIGMRELREKLLFHVAPPHDDKIWSGILSGISLASAATSDDTITMETSSGIKLTATSGDVATQFSTVEQNIQLVLSQTTSDGEVIRYFANEGDTYDEFWAKRWLDPSGFSWLPATDFIIADQLSKRNVFYVNLEATVSGVTRRERMVVPVFGKAQRTLAGKVFDDD